MDRSYLYFLLRFPLITLNTHGASLLHMTESGESVSSSNFDSDNTNHSEPEDDSFIATDKLDDFNIDKFVQEQIDSAVCEASRICADQSGGSDGKKSDVKFVSPLKTFANWCGTKCRFNLKKMISLVSLLWFLVHLALLFLRTSPIVREGRPPVPFFRPSNGTVQDLFEGNGLQPELLMSKAEFTIVMLYAPWDHRYIGSVKFVAANCHYYRGQCRRMYKVHSFPVIFAHTPYPNGHPILFNQVLSSDRLFSWVFHLLTPLQRLHSVDEFQNAVFSSDFLVVGHFSLERDVPLPRSYHVFLNAAYKSAGHRSSVAFAIVLNGTLAHDELGFDRANQINLYTFYDDNSNSERIASMDIETSNTKSREVIDWLGEQINEKYASKIVHDLELEDLENAGKSDALFRRLNSSSATLVLFANSLGLRSHSQSQIALRNFVKIFHHCPSNLDNLERRPMSDTFFRAPSLEHLFDKSRKICALSAEQVNLCCARFLRLGKCRRFVEHSAEDHSEPGEGDDGCETTISLLSEGQQFKRFCCARRIGNSTESEQLISIRHPELNRDFHSEPMTELEQNLFGLDSSRGWIVGAGCRLNRSLGFLIMDKRFGRHFMRKWGISTTADGELDSVAIVGREEERIFTMENAKTVTVSNLANFIDGMEKMGTRLFLLQAFWKELTGGCFWMAFLTRTVPTMPWCFSLAAIGTGPPKGFGEFIKFYIIDSSQNSFDWRFDFHRLPAVAFFPAKRGQESFAFRHDIAFTVPNLLGFIFPRCQTQLRWLLAFAICKGKCLERNARRIGQMVAKADDDIQMLRKMLRKLHSREGHIRPPFDAVHHFRSFLRRRKLQKAVLLRLSEFVNALRHKQLAEWDNGKQREMATSAVFANWIMTTNGKTRSDLHR
uniref:Uncharacterized protein n=1 Tax=Globodera rostochiensis TaxID=31243 RepID=A0A914HPH2_GLORO